MSVAQVLKHWERQGEPLTVIGANTRIWRQGEGEAVVCLHGVPASAFLYRKVLPALADNGLQGVAFDFPGMGLAERPQNFDYSWSGLAHWAAKAVDATGIEDFHLVVHDIGGPIGFDLIRQIPGRIRSLTILNTILHVASFRRPWVMEPFAHAGIRGAWLQSLRTPAWLALMRMIGVHDGPSNEELRAYTRLLLREDGGKAFLRIMRGFERTPAFEKRILAALKSRQFPAQILWGAQDPALKMHKYAPQICETLGLDGWTELRGKHFVQEDSPAEIAQYVAQLAQVRAG